MTAAYPETMTFPAGLATAPELSGLIDKTIERFTAEGGFLRLPVSLRFPRKLEKVFEAETKRARVRELRFTLSAAVGFMLVTTVTDPLFVPDLGWTALQMRLVASFVMLSAVIRLPRLQGWRRELSICAVAYFAILVIAGIPTLSHAMLAPYGLFISTLAIIYTTTTFPMRFQYALPFTSLCVVSIACMMLHDHDLNTQLAYALIFLSLVGVAFSLIATYRMERSARLGYLLASKEALRLFVLNATTSNWQPSPAWMR